VRAGWPPAAQAVISLVQVAGVGAGGPLLIGLMRKVRCRLEGRQGPPIRQPLLDCRKLAHRERTRPDQASWVFSFAPVLLLASALVVVAIVPLVATEPAFAPSADLFAVVYMLLLGSISIALGALDTGTAFGGMGASRAMTVGAVAEPALLITILALSIPARSSNLPRIVASALSHPTWLAAPQRLLALGAFVIVILAESGRLPIDNPNTHLELTMIHPAMVLEYAGADLALVTVGEGVRLALMIGLLANLFIPWGIASRPDAIAIAIGLVALSTKVALIGAAIAAFEVSIAKLRLFRVPELLAGAFVLSLLAAILAMVTA
jgi:formate hydrogenlyase subunit 4